MMWGGETGTEGLDERENVPMRTLDLVVSIARENGVVDDVDGLWCV
jgi:hypothetical protein